MEVRLVGWSTYKKHFKDIDAFLTDDVDRRTASFLCEKAIKEDIIKNKWKFSGEYHQYGKCGMPILSVDNCIGPCIYSWRAWGSLMAECWNEIEQTLKYDYMDFYMGCLIDKEQKHCEEEYKF